MVYDILPSENLKYDDIRDTLNAEGGSVNNTISSAFQAAANIQKWAKYKPVCLPTPFVVGTIKNDIDWNEEVEPSGGKNLPWWYGSYYSPVYTTPVINSLTDIAKDGEIRLDKVWTYNRPTGGQYAPYRLSDFRLYRAITTNKPVVINMPDELNTVDTFTIGIIPAGADDGGFNADDVKKFFPQNVDVYQGIYLKNMDTGVSSAYVDTTPISSSYEEPFRLKPTGNPIQDGGFGFTIDIRQKVRAYIFFSTSPGETNFDAMTKYSALMDETDVVYREFEMGRKVQYVYMTYTCANLSVNVETLADTYYIRQDNSIFKTNRVIREVYGTLTTSKNNETADPFILSLNATGSGTRADGTKFSIASVPNTVYYRTAHNFSDGFSYTFNGSGETSFTAYKSQADAESETNGITIEGMPIFNECVYNFEEAGDVGVITTDEAKILCSGTGQETWISFVFTCPDNSNVIRL